MFPRCVAELKTEKNPVATPHSGDISHTLGVRFVTHAGGKPDGETHEGMLVVFVDAAAVLLASLTVFTAAGPSVALEYPESSPIVADAPASWHGVHGPQSETAAPARASSVSLTRLSSTRGTSLLSGLASLGPAELRTFLDGNPQLVERTLSAPPAPRQVDRWWSSLGAASQHGLTTAAPQIIGNLDGIPFATRNQANRSHLRSVITELELTDPTSLGTAERVRQDEQLHMLYEIADALGSTSANPSRSLINLDVTGQGKATIVVGDLATADYVSYLMPGMFISVGESMVEWADTAARLYDEQVSWLTLLAEAGSADASASVATVAWIGYQTPHLLNVGSLDLAYEGRDAIASAVQGLQTLRGNDQPHVSLLAHSYGSTAAMLALTETSTTVDAMAMIGSPGAPAQSVADLNVRGEIYVGEAAWDPIPNSAFFGPDPGADAFGARVMSVAGGVDVITNRVLAGSSGHNEYFGPGTESMRNMALVGIDKGALVTDGTHTDAQRTIESVL